MEVAWHGRDRDGGPFSTFVDYSINDGKSWKTIYQQLDAASLTRGVRKLRLSSRLFSRSGRARLRVRVSDGFNEGSGISRRFSAVGRPPAVRINFPTKKSTIMSDSALLLSGSSVDDRGRPITQQLTWFAGKKRIAAGSVASTVGLAPGKRVPIRLVAKDAAGRKGSAKVRIHVRAAKPRILELKAPPRLRRKAKRVVIKLRSSLPSRISITGKGVKKLSSSAGFKMKSYAVKLTKPRGRQLTLRVRVAAGKKASHVALQMPLQ